MRVTWRRMAMFLFGAILGLVLIMAGLLYVAQRHFHPPAPEAHYPPAASALEAQRQDLDYFRRAIALDRAFAPDARKAVEARLDTLQALSEALPPARLQVALMQMMALADNGHSHMSAMPEQDARIVPLRVTRFAEGYYVTLAAPAHRDLLGGRVERIDDQPIEQVVARLRTLRGGVEGFRDENAAIYMVVQDLLHGLDIAHDPSVSTWTVTLPDGRTLTQQIEAYPLRKGDGIPFGGRWLSPEPGLGVEKDWVAYHPQSGPLPQTWQDAESRFRLFSTEDSCAQVVRLRSVSDTGTQKISDFLTRTEATLRADPPCAVILDLRDNDGGDYTNTWRFAHALPGLVAPGGRIFVLTNPVTFSAAITTAAFVKQAGGDQVTLIGEPVGDRLSFHSEGGRACLPHLGTCVFYQTAKHDYAHACDDWHECFWLNRFYPVRVASLQPDIAAPLRFEDWRAGRDAAYDVARELAERPAGRD